MKQEYINWIQNYINDHKVTAGLCLPACDKMVQKFPELMVCKGWIWTCGDKRFHFWCKTIDDEIVDPTAGQFKAGIDFYEEYNKDEHGPLPTGKCYNCGMMLYNGNNFCNDICWQETREHLGVIS